VVRAYHLTNERLNDIFVIFENRSPFMKFLNIILEKKSTRLVGRAGLEKISPLCFEPKQKSPGPVVAEETELEIQNQIALHLFSLEKCK
jgi:hypothetical protein